jgi:ABC-type uncharacterized transport system involved in gliding motility auxiliary subunit
MIRKQRISVKKILPGLGILGLTIVLVSIPLFRMDLTQEKRYSLSPQTKEIIKNQNTTSTLN